MLLLWRLDATEERSDDRQNALVVSISSYLNDINQLTFPAKRR